MSQLGLITVKQININFDMKKPIENEIVKKKDIGKTQ